MDGEPERVTMLPVPDWPDDYMELFGPADASLGTEHLPEEVVRTPFALAIWSKTSEDDPRRGGCQAQLSFGDRCNPTDLTVDEIEYIEAVLRIFIRKVRRT
jgi:hypothetical protein